MRKSCGWTSVPDTWWAFYANFCCRNDCFFAKCRSSKPTRGESKVSAEKIQTLKRIYKVSKNKRCVNGSFWQTSDVKPN